MPASAGSGMCGRHRGDRHLDRAERRSEDEGDRDQREQGAAEARGHVIVTGVPAHRRREGQCEPHGAHKGNDPQRRNCCTGRARGDDNRQEQGPAEHRQLLGNGRQAERGRPGDRLNGVTPLGAHGLGHGRQREPAQQREGVEPHRVVPRSCEGKRAQRDGVHQATCHEHGPHAPPVEGSPLHRTGHADAEGERRRRDAAGGQRAGRPAHHQRDAHRNGLRHLGDDAGQRLTADPRHAQQIAVDRRDSHPLNLDDRRAP